jgi:hypothetical protein
MNTDYCATHNEARGELPHPGETASPQAFTLYFLALQRTESGRIQLGRDLQIGALHHGAAHIGGAAGEYRL